MRLKWKLLLFKLDDIFSLIFESRELSFADTLPENELLKMNDARSTYKGGTKEQREGFFAQGTTITKLSER